MISAKIIADSVSPTGKRITTMELEYPRYIHAELLTHRVFSRNAASSRAVPVQKAIEVALANMVEPIRWGANMAGMQAATENLTGDRLESAQRIWRHMADVCAAGAQELAALGLHKQWANRPTEWFSHIRTVVTATEWDNFFTLRAHKDAQPEFQALAYAMRDAMKESVPTLLQVGEWHVPYVPTYRDLSGILHYGEDAGMPLADALEVSASCCAQVSYRKLDDSIEKAREVYRRLVDSRPFHASPFEHQATPSNGDDADLWGNLVGWVQHRKIIEHSERLIDEALLS